MFWSFLNFSYKCFLFEQVFAAFFILLLFHLPLPLESLFIFQFSAILITSINLILFVASSILFLNSILSLFSSVICILLNYFPFFLPSCFLFLISNLASCFVSLATTRPSNQVLLCLSRCSAICYFVNFSLFGHFLADSEFDHSRKRN